MFDAACAHFGTVHILVNNAAKFSSLTYKPMDEIPLDEWEEVIHTNVTGTFYCARQALAHMKRAGWAESSTCPPAPSSWAGHCFCTMSRARPP